MVDLHAACAPHVLVFAGHCGVVVLVRFLEGSLRVGQVDRASFMERTPNWFWGSDLWRIVVEPGWGSIGIGARFGLLRARGGGRCALKLHPCSRAAVWRANDAIRCWGF
eukprot:13476920-Heterocapsa_arctica.AAC.1